MHDTDIVTLVEYNNWANRQLITQAMKLAPGQITDDVGLSSKSAFNTLRHVVDVEYSWRLTCMGAAAKEMLWDIIPLDTLKQIKAYWQKEGDLLLEYVKSLSEEELEEEVAPSWIKKRGFKRKHLLIHIINHGTNHRCELGWYFTKQGHSPGDLEFLSFLVYRRKQEARDTAK